MAYLDAVIPPEDFVEATASSSELGAFALLAGDCPGPSEAVGRILGGGAAADERWAHLAGDPGACEAIKTSIWFCHITPAVSAIADPQERGRVANRHYGGRLCTPNGSKALLVLNTPRWDMCVQLAQHLSQREDEWAAAYAARCGRFDAWGAAHAFETAGVALLLLRQAVAFLCGANLFEGVPPHCLGILSLDALRAHERVPARLRPAGCVLDRVVHPDWLAPVEVAAADNVLRPRPRRQSGGGMPPSTSASSPCSACFGTECCDNWCWCWCWCWC